MNVLQEFRELPKERIGEEWRKLLLKSEKPSIGLRFAMDVGILNALHPELASMVGVKQDSIYHKEGDVFVHTVMAADTAADLVWGRNLSEDQAWVIMLAALCHDMGKVTHSVDHGEGRISAHGHDVAGVAPTLSFLESIGADNHTKEKVAKLVRWHMWPWNSFKANVSNKAFAKLADNLFPATIEELAMVCIADGMKGHEDAADWLIERSNNIGITTHRIISPFTGNDLIAMGFPQTKQNGPVFGAVIKGAREVYMNGLSRNDIIDILTQCDTLEEMVGRLSSPIARNLTTARFCGRTIKWLMIEKE